MANNSFVISDKRTISNWPWKIPVVGDNGSVTSIKAGIDIDLPTREEYRKFITDWMKETSGDVMATDDKLVDYIAGRLTGWTGFTLEDEKTQAEFSLGNLKAVLNGPSGPGARKSLQESFNAAMEGREVKN